MSTLCVKLSDIEFSLGGRLPFAPLWMFFFVKGSMQYSKHRGIDIPVVHMEVAFSCVGEKTGNKQIYK